MRAFILRHPYLTQLFVWVSAALFTTGYDHLDEHFQSLEQAGCLLWGAQACMHTWDWDAGLRSWLHVHILWAWLKPWVALGVDHRVLLDTWARFGNALWGLGILWAVRDLARPLSGRARESVTLWTIAAWPLWIFGVRHGSDTFGAPPMLVGFALLVRTSGLTGSGALTTALAAGFATGLAGELRFTTLLVSCVGYLFAPVRWARKWVAGAAVLLTFGALELWSASLYAKGGVGFKLPAWEFFQFNVVKGAPDFSANPWWELWVYFILMSVPGLASWVWFRRRAWTSRNPVRWLSATVLMTLLLFGMIRHKEMRFIFPLLAFTPLALVGAGWAEVSRRTRNLGIAWTALGILIVAIFYRSPHSSEVDAIHIGSTLARAESLPLAAVDRAKHLPQFFVNAGVELTRMGGDEFRAICAGEKQPARSMIVVYQGPEVQCSCPLVDQARERIGQRAWKIWARAVQSGTFPEEKIYFYRCSF